MKSSSTPLVQILTRVTARRVPAGLPLAAAAVLLLSLLVGTHSASTRCAFVRSGRHTSSRLGHSFISQHTHRSRAATTTKLAKESSTSTSTSSSDSSSSSSSSLSGNDDFDVVKVEDSRKVKTGVLRVYGPDQKGIVAAFSQMLYGHGCGIVDSEQFTDTQANLFFQRIHFDYTTMHTDDITLEFGIREVCNRFQMIHDLNWCRRRKRVAIMVSKTDHCLWELLLRHKAGEIDCDISVIVSNHPDLRPIADSFGIPFEVFKITKDVKKEQEAKELDLFRDTYNVDLVILARYMQIISDDFCNAFPYRVINIHHSFLPAFIGGKPYHRAHERGVKVIGATAHYATAVLDEGPIIEQDITRISHRDAVEDLLRKGRILEKNTLVTAVKAHLEDRIIVYKNKCVVFGE